MSVHSPPPQRPDGASRGAAREWLESERRRAEAPAFFSRSDAGPVGAGAGGDAPQRREAGVLGILQSERTASLVSIVVFLSVASFMLRGVTTGRVVLLAVACSVGLARFGAARYLGRNRPESAHAAAALVASRGAGAAGDAPQRREAGALRILKSDVVVYALSLWVLVGAGWLVTRGVTVGRVVLLAAGCFAALACFGATRYLRAKKPANAPTAPGGSTPGIEA